MNLVTKINRYCEDNPSPLILWGVSAYYGRALRAFRNNGIEPLCVIDSDKDKWGHMYNGLVAERPADALRKYPDAKIYIATFYHVPEIIGELTVNLRCPPERILNYEPVERRIGCNEIEMYMVSAGTDNNSLGKYSLVQFCHNDFGRKKSPVIDFDGDYDKMVTAFIEKREEMAFKIAHGIPCECSGCSQLKEKWYYKDRKVRYVSYSEHGGCNLNCIYCHVAAKRKPILCGNDINFNKLISTVSPYLSEDYITVFDAGEITVDPEREELYREGEKSADYILTNGTIYVEGIKKILAKGHAVLNVSIDAGTKETYANVKGVDCFEKTILNLKKYAEGNDGGFVHLKYIFLPGINDNDADIEGFVRLAKDIGSGLVIISHDLKNKELPDSTYKYAAKLISLLKEANIVFAIYSNLIKGKLFS